MNALLAALLFSSAAGAAPAASDATRAANAAVAAALPADAEDEDFAARGFIAALKEPQIKDGAGRVVWDFATNAFLDGAAPETVNPSLWRHAKLLARHGLFKAHDRIYQLRGFDVSNMSIIVGRTGLIVVDPLASVEPARAALALARETLGPKRVVAVIYTHSHVDHFGGVKGVVDAAAVASGKVRIYAPDGFLDHAVSENIIAGAAMSRRAAYQFGLPLEAGPAGAVTSGIGPGVSTGTRSLIPPTDLITKGGETHVIDGVKFVFQMTPESEAPAEMHFYLPEFRALCLAENANPTMHNVLTPRGALVRDAKKWADYLTEALRLYGDRSDVLFTSHGWPRFGADRVEDYIASHRDAYKFLHDQTVRLMNQGLTGVEIADRIELPKALRDRWFNRGYYGTMRHNSRAIYQRYMGWYDANPASLNILPKEATAARYVDLMGGAKKARKAARRASEAGDYRWAAEILDRVVFADPGDAEAKVMLAAAHRQMAYQAESAIWRNMYLTAAKELTDGVAPGAPIAQSLDFIAATPTAMLFDLLAVRLDPARAGEAPLTLNIAFPERKERVAVSVRNGVLVHVMGAAHETPDATIETSRAAFLAAMFLPDAPALKVAGDAEAWARFRTLFEAPDPNFAIVTP